MAGYIDLVALMKTYKGVMKRVVFYGNIVSKMGYPSCLAEGVETSKTGMFVRVDVYAVDLSYHAQYLKSVGVEAENNIYRVNGSLVTFVEQGNKKFPGVFKFEGTLRAYARCNNYFNVFAFRKSGNGFWTINPVFLEEVPDLYSVLGNAYADLMEKVNQLPRFIHKMGDLATPVEDNKSEVIGNTVPEYRDYGREGNSIFKPSCRSKIAEYSNKAKEYYRQLNQAGARREKFINDLADKYEDDGYVNGYIKKLYNNLVNSYKRKPTRDTPTGRVLVTKYLSKIDGSGKKYLGSTVKKFLADEFLDLEGYILEGERGISATGDARKVCEAAFGDAERFYVGVLSVSVSGVSFETMTELVDVCSSYGISMSRLLNENPYALQLFGASGKLVEHLALCFGKASDSSLDKYRNIAVVGSYIDDENGSTAFSKKSIVRARIGVSVTSSKYNDVKRTGTYLTQSALSTLDAYFGKEDRHYISNTRWFKSGGMYVMKYSPKEINAAVEDYLESGLGVDLGDYITSYALLNKELYVYNRMYELGSKTFDYDMAEIDKYIDEYEEQCGFKLEARQREAVHLCAVQAGVVTGGAGSGKTTSCDCFIYVLRKLDKKVKCKFAAPTGKAAKRLQEVVRESVKTMNSMFKIMGGSAIALAEDEDEGLEDRGVCYIFDENAMVTIDLLYSVLKRISDDSRVYLFGDFNQLLPIGKGLPFLNLLRFMPTVCLNVSKRAAEGSNITYNSDLINNASDISGWKDLKSGGDFLMCPCSESNMRDLAVAICRYYLGTATGDDKEMLEEFIPEPMPVIDGLTADDIQVVTPFAKATYTWGAYQLNKVLQPVFNTVRGYDNTFVYQPVKDGAFTKFLVGDRVIHTEKNSYSMQWYASYDGGVFKKAWGYGICNGEVGKIVGFVPASTCIFEDEDDDLRPDDFEYPDALRDDSTFSDDNSWFIIVKYHDYIGDTDFYIAYRALLQEGSDVSIGRAFCGDDLGLLNLFYAGTTHKMQGSQCKCVISLLGDVNYGGFITRNMIYTVYTRAEKQVFALGSVGNSMNSMLSRARRDVAGVDITTVGGLLC